jgi:hypothetical protein
MIRETRFGRTSPVLRYWLAHSEGFAVRGGAKGVVSELLRDGDPHQPAALVVRRRRRPMRTIDVSAVAAVLPDRRVLIVEKKRRRRVTLPRLALPRPALPSLPTVSIAPVIRLIRSMRWPRSVLSVRFAMTRVSPDRLQISWHRRTTSSRKRSAPDTSSVARTTSST